VESAATIRSDGTVVFASPDARTLAVTARDTLELWDISDPRRPFIRGSLSVSAGAKIMTSRPDNRMVLGVGKETSDGVFLWRVDGDPTLVANLPARVSAFLNRGAEFSADNRMLAAGTLGNNEIFGPGGGVALWELEPERVRRLLCGQWQNVVDRAEWKRYFPRLEYTTPCR